MTVLAETPLTSIECEQTSNPPTVLESQYVTECGMLRECTNVVYHDNGIRYEASLGATTLLQDFANGRIHPDAYRAALLQGIVSDSTDSLYGSNLKRELKVYSDTVGDATWQYVATLLHDTIKISKVITQERREPSNVDVMTPGIVAVLAGSSGETVRNDYWLEPSRITAPSRMLEVLKDVNLEAVFILATKTLHDLGNDSKQSDHAVLRSIHAAESFYAPLCELIGMDGLASALRDRASIIRLEKAGYGAVVNKASEMINDSITDREGALASASGLLGKLALGEFDVDHAVKDTSEHRVSVGTALVQPIDSKNLIRATWRIKTAGSLAMKLFRQHPELKGMQYDEQKSVLDAITDLPADILGLTLIAETDEELAAIFVKSLANILTDRDLALTHSPSRRESIHVKGGSKFTGLLSRVILTDGSKLFGDDWGAIRLDDIEVITVEDGSQVYEVAKTTVQIEHCTSAELQYVTERTRLSARAGLAAHLLYKLQKSPNGDGTMATVTDKDIAALSEIHKRRKELGSRELVNGSKEAAGQFMKRVSRSGGRRIVDWRWLIPTKKLNK